MSRYLYKKIQNISPESLNFQHSGLKLTTFGSDHLTNSVIHDANPVFDRKRLLFRYDNGMEEKIKVNRHLYEAGK